MTLPVPALWIMAPSSQSMAIYESGSRIEALDKQVRLVAKPGGDMAVPVKAKTAGNTNSRWCAADKLEMSFVELKDYDHGVFLKPLGPPPTDDTVSVNGVVRCVGSTYAFRGFEARWTGSGWEVIVVPGFSELTEKEEEAGEAENIVDNAPIPAPTAPGAAPAPKSSTVPGGVSGGVDFSGTGIDGYAPYQPQRTCDPTPKPKMVALRDLTLQKYPFTGSSGISRACGSGGSSEHKEGRAWDWRVNVNNAAERRAADEMIAWFMATDAQGNKHAMARRTGIMYIIWNRQIWTSYRANEGWRPYSGPSAHTDHVHISMSWDGALGRTSFWSGKSVNTFFTPPAGSYVAPTRTIATAPTTRRTSSPTTTRPRSTTTWTRAPRITTTTQPRSTTTRAPKTYSGKHSTPTTTQAPRTTQPPTTQAPRTTLPPTTQAPRTTSPPTTRAPRRTTTSSPPVTSSPSPAPSPTNGKSGKSKP